MAGRNTIEAKLKIAADFAEAVRDLKALRAEMKAAGADAKTAGTDSASGAKTTTAAERESAAAAKQAARERAQAAQQAAEAEKKAARDAAKVQADAARLAAAERRKAAALAPQVTDIVTGLAGGQNPLLVAIQQGGQLRDIMGGTGNAVKALLGLFTPLRIAVGGVAAAAALIGKAFFDSRSEADELQRSINVTGNVASTTVGQVNRLASEIAAEQKVSVGSVRETLNQLLQAGQVTSQTFGAAGRAATALSRATGQSADESAKLFANMGRDVTGFALRASQQYNALSASTVKRVRELESEGKSQEALRLALEEFAKTMEGRVVPSTNAVERAWQSLGRTVSEWWDRIKRAFDDETTDTMLKKLRERISAMEAALANTSDPATAARRRAALEALKSQESELARIAIADQNRREAAAQAAQKNQEKVEEESKAFQDAISNLAAAEAQKRLATQMAALDAQRAAIELDHKRGLTDELDYNLKLNAIEQQRLKAQAANVQRQIELAQQRVTSKPEERKTRDAAVTQLEAELVALRSRLAQAQGEMQGLVIDDAAKQAEQWQKKWEQAISFVARLRQQNQLEDVATSASADPAERARAAAKAATEELRDQIRALNAQLLVKLGITLDSTQEQQLKEQLARLADEGGKAIDAATRKALLTSFKDQFAALTAELRSRESAIDEQASTGTITSAEAERQLLAVRADMVPLLERILSLQKQIAATSDEKRDVSQATAEVSRLKASATEFELVMRTSVRDSFSQTFTDFISGAKSAGEAFRDFVKGIASAMLQLIARRLGEQLVDSLFGKAGAGGSSGGSNSGGWSAILAQWFASLFHGGGVVGGVQSMSRAVSPMLFATAARYHSGGLAGLGPDEVPAVLKKGEEVITETDPRHRNNGGMAAIGNLNINMQISTDGAGAGNEARLAQRLGQAMRKTAVDVLTEEMRPGGLLATR